MTLDSIITVVHILGGAAFAVTIILMQTVVSPAMAKIPAGQPKAMAAEIIQGRARLAMDIVILLQSATALYLLATKWNMIWASFWLGAKVAAGATALFTASLLHFYWRGKKARLKQAGETGKFEALSAFTLKMEKVALVLAPTAFVMGIIWGHL